MRVLHVDDDPLVLRSVRRQLQLGSVAVAIVSNPTEALAALGSLPHIDVVISDYDMPGMDGATFLGIVARRWPRVRRVLLTGSPRDAKLRDAVQAGVVEEVVSKAEPVSALLAALGRLSGRARGS